MSQAATPPVPRVLDYRGLRCPMPIVRLAADTRGEPAGTTVTVLWTDPAARSDLAAWARMRGANVAEVVPAEPLDGVEAWATTLVLGPPR
ncbi:sulfurtransferase TusA family protein [Actinotalea sp. M2MS4P-6]|uniref:sulfurtransferase TusA family protein n=1 Tax=Actinotalea sp. M2MS4P-6 TaxID=2983762 RepID=UPI0021E4FA49|nr:sulfurtransferase TusA family protein [Actinotalea sp. M2MS4P-6]MCV2396447.1 sulfurtransferase TusA family protein [Actinotalea sp. M2MS4P-6]